MEEEAPVERVLPSDAGQGNSIKFAVASELKSLSELWKELLVDLPLRFCSDSVRLSVMDASECSLLNCELRGTEYRYCGKDSFSVILASDLHRSLKLATSSLPCSVILSDHPTSVRVDLKAQSKSLAVVNDLYKSSQEFPKISIPPLTYQCALTISSSDLARFMREVNASRIRITVEGETLTLEGAGSSGATKIVIGSEYFSMVHTCKEKTSGVFSLKFLLRFVRNLAPSVTLYIDDVLPLLLQYELISSSVRLMLSPDGGEGDASEGREAEKSAEVSGDAPVDAPSAPAQKKRARRTSAA